MSHPPGMLELEEHVAFQHRLWRWQRVGWLVMTLVLVAALGGVFGDGPLAAARVGGDFSVRYERFARRGAPTTLEFALPPAGSRLDVAGAASRVEVRRVTPAPVKESRSSDGERWSLWFEPAIDGSSTVVRIETIPRRAGRGHSTVTLDSSATIDFRQFVWP